MSDPFLDKAEANAVYDILVKECGASESGREAFVIVECSQFVSEYRFMGALGFGGKVWRTDGRWRVSCYREDENPERLAMMSAANEALLEVTS